MRLYHVSETPGIERFEPRVPPSADAGVADPVVWAVDEQRLRNYLLPRDCPRVTFYSKPTSTPADVECLIGPCCAAAVVAIEADWLDRVRATVLYLYEMPRDTFSLADASAGYWVSRRAVVPGAVAVVSDCVKAIVERGVELRIVPNLWPLHDAVVASTLHFSSIRMRNAQPRPGRDVTAS